jgi:hypothetical protein
MAAGSSEDRKRNNSAPPISIDWYQCLGRCAEVCLTATDKRMCVYLSLSLRRGEISSQRMLAPSAQCARRALIASKRKQFFWHD